MKKYTYYWAFCAALVFFLVHALAVILENNLGNYEDRIIVSLIFRFSWIFPTLVAAFCAFSKPTNRNRGILLGALAAMVAMDMAFQGRSFNAENFFKGGDTWQSITLFFIPVFFLTASVICVVNRNFELAKVFAFITVVSFAYFFLAQLNTSLFPRKEEHESYGSYFLRNIYYMWA